MSGEAPSSSSQAPPAQQEDEGSTITADDEGFDEVSLSRVTCFIFTEATLGI